MEYITYDGSRLTEVRCKGCSTPIATARGPLPNYSELVIEMREKNGALGKHETCMCKACKDRIIHVSLDGELQELYASDIEQWIVEGVIGAMSPIQIVMCSNQMQARVPLRALDMKGRG